VSSKDSEVAAVMRDAFTMENGIGDLVGVVEMLQGLSQNTKKIALAISNDAGPGRGVDGGYITCLTEANMDVAVGLRLVADAIREGLGDLAEAIREHGKS